MRSHVCPRPSWTQTRSRAAKICRRHRGDAFGTESIYLARAQEGGRCSGRDQEASMAGSSSRTSLRLGLEVRLSAGATSLAPSFQTRPPVGEMTKQLVQFSHANGNSTNLQSALVAWWDGRHKFIEHARCPPTLPGIGEPTPSDWWSAGVCLCSQTGRKRQTFKNKSMATLKVFFARRVVPCGSNVYAVLQGRAHDVGVENDPEEEQVWHISDVDLSQ